MPRVCVHTDPPPPAGKGRLYDCCYNCNNPMKPKRIRNAPADKWRLQINGFMLVMPDKSRADLISMGRVLVYSNIVWMVSPTGIKIDPRLLPH